MGKWNKAFKRGLVAAGIFMGVLMGSLSEAEAQACESYRKARLFCDLNSNTDTIPVSVGSDLVELIDLRFRYETASVNVTRAKSEYDKNKPRSIYNACKASLEFKIQASRFHLLKGKSCQERAEVCMHSPRCGQKEKASCQLMRAQSEWSHELAETYYDSGELELLRECMAKYDVDEEVITASVKRIPVPTPARR